MAPEDLLAHAGFMQSLAKALVQDEHAAFDLMQETWRCAIESPPKQESLVQPWIARVMKNLAISIFRRDQSLKKRHQAQPRPDVIASPLEIIEKEEVRRQLIHELLKQPEPYRSVLIFRYYEDQTPMQIAQRQGIPLETVKSRLKRGLRRLKERLDELHGGDRRQWVLGLAGLKLTTVSEASAGLSSILSGGALIMSMKSKITLLVGLVILMASGYWLHNTILDPKPTKPSRISDNHQFQEKNQGVSKDQAPSKIEKKSEERASMAPKGFFLSGQVLDKDSNAPVPRFYVKLNHAYGYKDRHYEVIEHPEGRYNIPVKGPGKYYIKIGSAKHLEWNKSFLFTEEDLKSPLICRLDPGCKVFGKVVNRGTGAPMEGVLVAKVYYYLPFEYIDYRWNLDPPFSEEYQHDITDENGCFCLSGIQRNHRVNIVAIHNDFAQAGKYLESVSDQNIVLELSKGHRITCKVLDDNNNPIEGIGVKLWGPTLPLGRVYKTGPDGTCSALSKIGIVYLSAGETAKGFVPEAKTIRVYDQDVEVEFGPSSSKYATWKALLCDHKGNTISQADIRLKPSPSYPWPFPRKAESIFERKGKTDNQGGFVFRKLPPGPYHLDIFTPKTKHRQVQSYSLQHFVVQGPGLFQQDLVLPAVGGISGDVIDGRSGEFLNSGYITVKRKFPTEKLYQGQISDKGDFSLTGLEPGVYSIKASSEGFSSENLNGVEVREDKTTKGLRIVLSAASRLMIRLEGFAKQDFTWYACKIRKPGCYQGGWTFSGFGPSSCEVIKYNLSPGTYKFCLMWPRLNDLGFLEHAFVIKAMKNEEKTFHPSDMKFFKNPIAIMGRVKDGGGRGLSGVNLQFKPIFGYSHLRMEDRFHNSTQAKTGQGGRFELEGLWPGTWQVHAKLPEGVNMDLPLFNLPMNVRSPHLLDLEIPSCTLQGKLGMGSSRLSDATWKLVLKNSNDGRKFTYKGRGEAFKITVAPAGTYLVELEMAGFYPYKAESITLSPKKPLNLGNLPLDPCGAVILYVKYQNGMSVKSPMIYINNKYYYNQVSCKQLKEGGCQLNRLPLGPVKLMVRSNDYVDDISECLLDLNLLPGKVERIQVVLK